MYTQEEWAAEFCSAYNNKDWDICANLLDAVSKEFRDFVKEWRKA